MTELEILQEQFRDMSRKFPGLTHILLIWRNTEQEPELATRYKPTKEALIALWGNGLTRDFTPEITMKHWLIKPRHLSWSTDQGRDNYLKFAEKCGRIVCEKGLLYHLKLPKFFLKLAGSKLTNTQYTQFWTLVVHFLGNVERYTNDPRDMKTCWIQILKPKISKMISLHSFYEIQKDVFLESSLVISQLLEMEKETPSSKYITETANSEPLTEVQDSSTLPNEPITLIQFMESYCKNQTQALLNSRKKSLQMKEQKGDIQLPKQAKKWKRGQSKYYYTHDLLKHWPDYCKELPNLPELDLKKSGKSGK